MNAYYYEIMRLAEGLGVNVATEGNAYTCPQVRDGATTNGYEMAGALRLMTGEAVGVIAFGWIEYKDTCANAGIPWGACVALTHPDQIKQCRRVLIGLDADRRQDWAQWVKGVQHA